MSGYRNLVEAIRHFSDEDVAHDFVVKMRWADGVVCPHCGGKSHTFVSTRRIWKCRECKKQFSVKVGTIFEDSPIKLGIWLSAVWMITNAKNGISSHEIARNLGCTQKTAWFMSHRIRLAMQRGSFEKFTGPVEIDETWIGGCRSNMHKARKDATGGKKRGMYGKTPVMGILARGGHVIAMKVDNVKKKTLCTAIEAHVETGATVYTDSLSSYDQLEPNYSRGVIDHSKAFVDGEIHVNGIENFWSLFKRCIKGTHIHLDPRHLNSYLDEETFRFNNRKATDADRFELTMAHIGGKRIMYRDLIARV